MEMYASSGTSRGGVLEANGAASVKYRAKDIIVTMHGLDAKLQALDAQLDDRMDDSQRLNVENAIKSREKALFPVYEQIAVQFCDLHDTPGRMKAVGVIEKEVVWKESRSFFYWRLRRKLAEFDLRKKMQNAVLVGRASGKLHSMEASAMMEKWFLETTGFTSDKWNDDKMMLSWMAQSHEDLERKVTDLAKESVVQEVYNVLTNVESNSAKVGTAGIVDGISRAYKAMAKSDQDTLKDLILAALK